MQPRWLQMIKKCIAPIHMFKKISDKEYVAIVPLPGIKPSDVCIQWECNQHISINTCLQKHISVFTKNYSFPLYYHYMIAPPYGTTDLQQIHQQWDNGLLILTYQRDT
jgi:HSP20 family molecular chaperone IbpA